MSYKSFQDLIVWKKSMKLAKDVYMFGNQLPQAEKYGLVGQMQRCAVSIPSNIAEGSKRGSKKEYRKFLHIARGSVAELETQLLFAGDVYNIQIEEVYSLLKEAQKMLEVLLKRLLEPEN